MRLVDLHTHSNASDGELSPAQVVRLASQAGLAAVALTDHDTLQGLPEARAAGMEAGIEVIPGCELSVVHQGRELHLLGLWVRPDGELSTVLESLRAGREDRNRRIVEKLAGMGVAIDYDEVVELAQGTVGRPHIARILLERGLVRDYDAAFRQYLGRHGRAFVAKEELPAYLAARVLADGGATVALAHPYLLGASGRDMEELARRFQLLGVDAIEAYYTEHSDQKTREYLELARRLDLGVCGGSDFHGAVKPGIRLGVGKGRLKVPESVLDALKERRAARGLWV
ncbi:5'-3' exoribonuclease [Fundidesulfovibrio magnetotacticus]|uniref:5'-3' exoribonuclease n=1 Tax=Fundidesulfovibrio magnetotacticus TaxID=2730080 RepID=A0A6V8LK66_9BACT|nr:PHP domain-containing protein [Fundidesulfovibrio magnetotacticus]GFK93112.1 5'-3' exoribonuclease [Fundidesulfovibrio magnetotacticus]